MTVSLSGAGIRRRSPWGRIRKNISLVLAYALLAVLVVWALLPLSVMISTSFKERGEIFQIPANFLPKEFTWDNYATVFTKSDMPISLRNSLTVGALVTVITLILGCTTGYALARIRFAGSRGLAVAMLLGQLLPVTVLLLPLFQLVAALKLIDSIRGLALTHLVFVLPLVTWMANSTFRTVPVELEEAAMIDGCSRPRAVWSVVLPVAAPGIVSIGIFAFLQSWNEFLFASVITVSEQSKTAPVALADFAGQFATDWGATMAGATVIALPITIAFLFVQRFFVRGMSAGAVKG